MTYSLVGKCRRTGMFGAAVTTSSMNVGSRCAFAKAGAGAVLTQHRTDNRLGPQGLALLEGGKTAPEVIDALVADNPTIGWRQLAVVDRNGGTGFHHGDHITSIHAAAMGDLEAVRIAGWYLLGVSSVGTLTQTRSPSWVLVVLSLLLLGLSYFGADSGFIPPGL